MLTLPPWTDCMSSNIMTFSGWVFLWNSFLVHLSTTCYQTWHFLASFYLCTLTHWGWVTHICISKLTIIVSDNGLLPGRCQAIIWTNAGLLSIGPLGTNISEILLAMHTFSFKKMHLKMLSGKWRPSCLSLSVLRSHEYTMYSHHPQLQSSMSLWQPLLGLLS